MQTSTKFQGKAVVFGGSGFIGRYVVRELAAAGWQIQSVSRNPENAAFLKAFGAEGQIETAGAVITNKAAVAKIVADASLVVNLVAILSETRNQKFEDLHFVGAKIIAEAAAEANVQQLVHFSSIGVSETSKARYAATKARGESAVLKAFPTASIIRPSVVFGAEDQFFNRFAEMAKFAPALPLVGGGNSLFQPVFAGDLARAVVAISNDEAARGKIFELGGPEAASFKSLLQRMLKMINKKRILMPLPFPLAHLMASVMEFIPGKPLTRDQVEMLKSDNVVAQNALAFKDLGLEATLIDDVVPGYMEKYR
jgi:uncharacterized protein YbjT (DUF2867 family)